MRPPLPLPSKSPRISITADAIKWAMFMRCGCWTPTVERTTVRSIAPSNNVGIAICPRQKWFECRCGRLKNLEPVASMERSHLNAAISRMTGVECPTNGRRTSENCFGVRCRNLILLARLRCCGQVARVFSRIDQFNERRGARSSCQFGLPLSMPASSSLDAC